MVAGLGPSFEVYSPRGGSRASGVPIPPSHDGAVDHPNYLDILVSLGPRDCQSGRCVKLVVNGRVVAPSTAQGS